MAHKSQVEVWNILSIVQIRNAIKKVHSKYASFGLSRNFSIGRAINDSSTEDHLLMGKWPCKCAGLVGVRRRLIRRCPESNQDLFYVAISSEICPAVGRHVWSSCRRKCLRWMHSRYRTPDWILLLKAAVLKAVWKITAKEIIILWGSWSWDFSYCKDALCKMCTHLLRWMKASAESAALECFKQPPPFERVNQDLVDSN